MANGNVSIAEDPTNGGVWISQIRGAGNNQAGTPSFKLHADDPGTDDTEPARETGQCQQSCGIDYARVVEQPLDGWHLGPAAGGNDYMTGVDVAERSVGPDQRDTGLAEDTLYTASQL